MAETTYGVYVSIRTPEGLLWSSSRAEWVEVEKDLDAAFGEGFGRSLIDSLRKIHQQAEVIPFPRQQPSEAQALETVQRELGATPEPASAPEPQPQQQPQFEVCNICGTLKDKWNPPGVSKSGKRYPGFFGCPNFRNHPRA